MRAIRVHLFNSPAHKRFGRLDQSPRRINHVIQHNYLFSLYITDYIHRLCNIRRLPAFVYDGKFGMKPLGKGAGAFHSACIRRYNNKIFDKIFLDIVEKDRGCKNIINGYVKKTLYLAGMKIHRDDTVGPCHCNHVGD